MSKIDFHKARRAANMSSRGHEPVSGSDLAPKFRKPRKSKAAQRTDLAKLMSSDTMITKTIACRCGHKGKVRVPVSKASGPFRCVKCKTRTR